MSSENKRPSSAKMWAKAITDFRKKLRLNKADFASELGVSAVAISHWESGRSEPSEGMYVKLFNKAWKVGHTPSVMDFARRAGIDIEGLRGFAPEMVDALKRLNDAGIVMVPIRRASSLVGASKSADADEWVPVAAKWIPNPESTFCMRASKRDGGTDLVFIDTSVADDSAANIGSSILGYFAPVVEGDRPAFALGRLVKGAKHFAISADWQIYESPIEPTDDSRLHLAGPGLSFLNPGRGDCVIGRAILRIVSPVGGAPIPAYVEFLLGDGK